MIRPMSDTQYLLPGTLPHDIVQEARFAPEITHTGASVPADVASCASRINDEGPCMRLNACMPVRPHVPH